ncbi:MAG: class III signal peptide-containing protein [Candidatus Diapherotrites archaeon]|nr:class III signal peptide-containing protein [Candidatus Diapherotrites archaeon]
MLKEEKAQTSLEYLLILGGAVAAATAIGVYLKSVPKATGAQIKKVYETT